MPFEKAGLPIEEKARVRKAAAKKAAATRKKKKLAKMRRKKAELTPELADAIARDFLEEGKSKLSIQKARNVSLQTVDSSVTRFVKQARDAMMKAGEEKPKRENVIVKAYAALESGLDHPENPYLQGRLGLDTLAKTGEFGGDNPSVQVNQIFANIPDEFAPYFVTSKPPVRELLEAAEIEQED